MTPISILKTLITGLIISTGLQQALAANTVSISVNASNAAAIKSDGSLWTWGGSLYGNLGNGTDFTDLSLPSKIGEGFSEVSIGDRHTLALKPDGSLWGWGLNSYGQLGEGARAQWYKLPIKIGEGFINASAGTNHSMAIKSDGSLWVWGRNANAAFGNPSLNELQYNYPTKVGTGYKKVFTSDFVSMAIRTDNSLVAWGNNWGKAIGLNNAGMIYQPTEILKDVKTAATNSYNSLAVKLDGTLWSWGDNFSGQAGVGSFGGYVVLPTKIGTGFSEIGLAQGAASAVKSDGSLWTWGKNDACQLGNGACGSSESKWLPEQIGTNFSKIDGGQGTFIAIDKMGQAWSWGTSNYDLLGYPISTKPKTPAKFSIGIDSTPSVFDAVAYTTGSIYSLNASASIQINSPDTSQNGSVFVIAIAPNGYLFTFTQNGWEVFNSANVRPWSGQLSNITGQIINGMNVSGLSGFIFVGGYGKGSNPSASLTEMIQSGRYKILFSIN